jgi:hypothetical protein
MPFAIYIRLDITVANKPFDDDMLPTVEHSSVPKREIFTLDTQYACAKGNVDGFQQLRGRDKRYKEKKNLNGAK